jgi:hypothetical protein
MGAQCAGRPVPTDGLTEFPKGRLGPGVARRQQNEAQVRQEGRLTPSPLEVFCPTVGLQAHTRPPATGVESGVPAPPSFGQVSLGWFVKSIRAASAVR